MTQETGGIERDARQLAIMQAYPPELKLRITKQRIKEWVREYGEDHVCVSFSGGKDSTVLLNIVREDFPRVRAVFSNTGLEYPEIQRFVKQHENVDVVTPKMRFDHVISTYGYPLISKEVAEAIYYARRIRSQTVQVERERQQRRVSAESLKGSVSAKQTNWQTGNDWKSWENKRLIQTSTARNRRTVLLGRMPGAVVVAGRNIDADISGRNCMNCTSEDTEPG